ncbi:hypothetical protein VNO77_39166 [Canavalia gladiata]|uniref:Uncharacterized protein n=1 Tax=Canavalia gladiata TaxID=3824 RepID=A0AAN9KDY3_CANGL
MKSSLSGEEIGLNYLQVCFSIVIILPKHIAYVLAIRLSPVNHLLVKEKEKSIRLGTCVGLSKATLTNTSPLMIRSILFVPERTEVDKKTVVISNHALKLESLH